MKALPTGLSTRSKSLPTRSIFCIRAALDVPLAKLFDYSIPAGMEARVGDRVVVPFGARQRLGVVIEAGVTSELPAARVKPIVALRDDGPRLPADWLELMRFLSGYYQRPLGETVISALPPRLRSVKPLPRKALQSASAPWSARFVPNHLLNPAQALAVLAPLPKLALVVADEEHDTSFKQQEGLRYSARDVAVYRAKLAGCPAILGTATPSLESWHNWQSGRYERLELPERAVPGARLPAVRTIDLRHASLQQGLAAPLLAAIEARLKNSEQSLVFINRRGYAPVLACEACGWTAGCARCTARMVVHAVGRVLRCHHCGAESAIPRACPTCGNVDLKPMGRGTQRIEETLAAAFPGARIVRIDRDSARRRAELLHTLQGIQRGEADILVGTQLLAKGHDFPGLTLVGVLNADAALLSTDYRAPERLFAVLAQVAGRAGRRAQQGRTEE